MPNRWKSGSVFGTGPRVPLSREQRAVYKAKIKLQRRPGRLTIGTAAVGLALLDIMGADGQCDPSQATIANKARVDLSTVKRALVQLQQCGFVQWTRRLVRDARSHWRVEQGTNAYVLTVPTTEVQIALAVRKKGFSSVKRPATDHEIRINAARQLIALGAPIPPAWGLSAVDCS